MITLYDFNKHKLDGRAQMAWDHGTYIALRCEEPHSVALYHMGEFFAEVWYSPTDNKIIMVRGFKSRRLLEPYAEMVDLREILN